MGTNYYQDQENTSKFQQCLSYANSDKMIKNGQNKEELSPRKDFYLQKSMLWPDNVFEISNFLAHLRDNGVCLVQVCIMLMLNSVASIHREGIDLSCTF